MQGLAQKTRNVKGIQSKASQGEDVFTVCDEDGTALIASLKACAQSKDLHRGSRIHTEIVTSRLLEKNVSLGNTLVSMYAKCGALKKAQDVFDELPLRNEVTWNALIAGYSLNGHGEEALNCFEQMQFGGFSPDALTFCCILKACGSIRALDKGKEIHAQILRGRLLEKHVMVGNALIDMYAKCGALETAHEVFDVLSNRNVISWTTLITGYVHHEHGEDAVKCFEQMQMRGFSPNGVTFACALKACGNIGALDKGIQIHAHVLREGLLKNDIVLANALVDMYAKCGALQKAQEVFDELPVQSVVSWTALIAGYYQYGCGEEALSCFEQMLWRGVHPDVVTFVCILKACGSMGALDKGQEIHTQVVRDCLIEKHRNIGYALMDMYARCGALEKARDVFDKLELGGTVSWSAQH